MNEAVMGQLDSGTSLGDQAPSFRCYGHALKGGRKQTSMCSKNVLCLFFKVGSLSTPPSGILICKLLNATRISCAMSVTELHN